MPELPLIPARGGPRVTIDLAHSFMYLCMQRFGVQMAEVSATNTVLSNGFHLPQCSMLIRLHTCTSQTSVDSKIYLLSQGLYGTLPVLIRACTHALNGVRLIGASTCMWLPASIIIGKQLS